MEQKSNCKKMIDQTSGRCSKASSPYSRINATFYYLDNRVLEESARHDSQTISSGFFGRKTNEQETLFLVEV